jgi:NADH-quinone oxidoreductase subunit N
MYGMSFVIGMSGSTAFSATRLEPGVVGLLAAGFVMAGLLAKLSAAPFQWWAPDGYAGAPIAAVAYVSSVPKIAGILAFARVVGLFAPQRGATWLLVAAAVASMLIGNLAAYPQQDIRRLMAYSGIAHAGYLLVALATGTETGFRAAVFYSIAYAVPSMGAVLIASAEGPRIDDIRGLARRRPWAAWTMVLLLVSLIGVPPLAGFTGKLYVFSAALTSLPLLVVLALAMSVVSAGFYFRIIRAMFFAEPVKAAATAPRSPAVVLAIVACAACVVALGLASSPLLGAIVFAR